MRERRQERGLSQQQLADAAELTRQTVGAIEAGRSVPGVDVALRLARALGCTVEELFAEPRQASVMAAPVGERVSGRVTLAEVAGRWVAHPLGRASVTATADGVATALERGRLRVDALEGGRDARDNVVIMGCAAALGLLSSRLNASGGAGRFLWFEASSAASLEALGQRHTHLAGVHLVSPKTGEANVEAARLHARKAALTLVTLARWQAGFVTAPGNPRRVRRGEDLARSRLRIVTREEGSGARRLLDGQLREVASEARPTPTIQAAGHLEVAQLVASGAADVGVATQDAALAYGLEFVPIAEERYDLALPTTSLGDLRVARLLDALTHAAFRRELETLGYDAADSGRRVAEIPAS